MDLVAQRFRTQRLSGSPLPSAEAVVRLLGAVQSQDYPGAKWSLGQRMSDPTDAAIDRALDEGRILRTHVLRPTWHFVTPDDIRWMLELSAPRVLAQSAYYFAKLGLEPGVFRRAHVVLERELTAGRHRTREELAAALRRRKIEASGERLAYIVAEAELTGLLCSGALRGKRHTYALLEERAPQARKLRPDEALAELTCRFFEGHGPATLRHYAWWGGLTLGEARRGLEMVGGPLVRIEVGGSTCWMGRDAPDPPARDRAAYLVPEYDEALLGYKEPMLADLPRAAGLERRPARWVRPIVIAGGRAGSWRRTFGRSEVSLETDVFARLDTGAEREIEKAAERFGRFLGKAIRVIRVGRRRLSP